MISSEEISPAPPWWQKKWAQNVGLVLAGVIAVYGMIYWDVVSRAKEAYMEGEKFMQWNDNPQNKADHFQARYGEEKEELNRLLKLNKLSQDEYRSKLNAIEFDRDFRLKESSLKYAYQWYKDTYELFSPPESKWVRMARQRTPEALALWKEELRAKNIHFEDYMFE